MNRKMIIAVLCAVAFIAIFAAVALYFLNERRAMSIVFVGDTGQGDQAQDFVQEFGFHESFKNMRAALRNGDFLIGNLETPIAGPELPILRDQKWHPKQDPALAAVYAEEKFTAFSLANNHILDFGATGMRQTIAYLTEAGIRSFGAGENDREAQKPLIIEKNGIKIGVLGYFEVNGKYSKLNWYAAANAPGAAALTAENIKRDIAALKKHTDLIVVYPHWGANYQQLTGKQKKFAHLAVKAGADLVIGHGPHMPHIVEIYRGVPVVYSVGNFIWHSYGLYKKFDVEDQAYTLVARVTFTKNGVRRIELTPFHSNNRKVHFVPRAIDENRARKLFASLLEPIDGKWHLDGDKAVIE